jgi:hypothetical protein
VQSKSIGPFPETGCRDGPGCRERSADFRRALKGGQCCGKFECGTDGAEISAFWRRGLAQVDSPKPPNQPTAGLLCHLSELGLADVPGGYP